MERSPHWYRIQDVVTSRQIMKAGKVIGIKSLRETIKVQDPNHLFYTQINLSVTMTQCMYR